MTKFEFYLNHLQILNIIIIDPRKCWTAAFTIVVQLFCDEAILLPELHLEMYFSLSFDIHRKLWLTIVANLILGTAMAIVIVPAYSDIYAIAQ